MTDHPGHTQTDDHRIHGEPGAHVTVQRIEQSKDSEWRRPAVYIAILAFLVAFWAEREGRLSEYYAVDLKQYMVQHGLHPPPDPWSGK